MQPRQPIGSSTPLFPTAQAPLSTASQQPADPHMRSWERLEQEVCELVQDPLESHGIIQNLRGAFAGAPVLRLDFASPAACGVMHRLSADAWRGLEKRAVEDGSVPVTSAIVPFPLAGFSEHLAGIIRGLAGLTSLAHVGLVLPVADEALTVDLGALPESVGHVRLQLNPETHMSGLRLEVNVREGVRVDGEVLNERVMVHKSMVHFSQPDGASAPRSCTLQGVPYLRQATDFDLHQEPHAKRRRIGAEPGALIADRKAATMNLNGKGHFSNGRAIVCRHLASHWVDRRARYHQVPESKSEAGTARFSFADFLSAEDISSTVTDGHMDFEVLRQRDFLDPSDYTCRFDQAGSYFERHFRDMGPGEVRHLMLATGDHSLAAELQVKVAAPSATVEYAVTLYDPNKTATHVRSVFGSPAQLNDKPLAWWLGRTVADEYAKPDPRAHYQIEFTPDHLQILQSPPPNLALLARRMIDRTAAQPGMHELAGREVQPIHGTAAEIDQCRQQRLRVMPAPFAGRLVLAADGPVEHPRLDHQWASQLYLFGVSEKLCDAFLFEGATTFYAADPADFQFRAA